jgi:FAD/FMN-containing dehydrogenase
MDARPNRREFLRRGGQAALAVAGVGGFADVAGCGSSRPGNDLRRLARQVSGPVLVPGDPGYGQARLLFNPSFDAARPLAIVYCQAPRDVATAVDFARRHGLRVAARSGGHSFGGYSSPTGGIVVDVSRMRRLEVAPDRASAVVEPGVLNTRLYAGLGGAGLAVPSGTCPTVGLGGLCLGGGFGYSSRKLGLTADNLLELELVSAFGERLTCSADERPDLFWACRGGGGGNFGVATSYRFRVHPVGDVSIFQLAWRWRDAEAVVDAWQSWASGGPDELFSTCSLSRAGGGSPRGPTITSEGQYFGSTAALAALLAPLEAAARPIQRSISSRSYVAAQQVWADCEPSQCARRAANPYKVKSAFFADPMPAAGIRTAIEQLDRWPGTAASSPAVGLQLNSWGGAIARVPPSATAFVHRDARFLGIFGTTWSQDDMPSSVAANRTWLERFYTSIRPYASGFAYQNLIDRELADWAYAYYGSNLPRLEAVKRRYDPTDVFRFAQGLQP